MTEAAAHEPHRSHQLSRVLGIVFGLAVVVGGVIGSGIMRAPGVVTYPDGSRYAIAVFTRAHTYVDRQPLVDASIGRGAFAAVEALRS